MENKNDDLGPRKGETSDQFKARITETQRELNRQAAAAKPAPAPEPTPAPAPASKAPEQVPTPAAPVERPAAPATTPKQGPTGNPEVDAWWEKKGFKSTEDLANSYRELEREQSRRYQEEARARQSGQNGTPQVQPPAYPPYYPPAPVQPMPTYGYPPVQAPYAPVPYAPTAPDPEQLAKKYGMTPEDFERVAALANDMADAKVDQRLRAVMPTLVNDVRNVQRETVRNRELVNLMSDPAFKNPQVQYEMHRVLTEDPSIFQRNTSPERYAFDEALKRLGRAQFGGSNSAPTVPAADTPQGSVPSSRPPTTAGGNGNGGGGAPSGAASEAMTTEAFAKLPRDQKESYLRSVGALGR